MSQPAVNEDVYSRGRHGSAELYNLQRSINFGCGSLLSLQRRNDLKSLTVSCINVARQKLDETADLSAADYRAEAIAVMQKTIDFLQTDAG